MRAEESGLSIASWLQRKPGWHKLDAIEDATGLSYSQIRSGLQWFRRVGGVTLGHTIVCDKATDTYALCDEFGQPLDGSTLSGYDVRICRDSASRAMTQYGIALTGYNRAGLDNLVMETATYRKRCRGLRVVLETYSEEAERVGDAKEHLRIETYLELNAAL